MSSRYAERLKAGLWALLRQEKDAEKRAFIRGLLEDLEKHLFTVEQQIQTAKMIGLRNPAFDGDEVGYPEDDFK